MTDEPSIEVWLDSGEGAERSCNMESRGELPEKECSQRKRRRSGNMNSQKEPPPSGLVPSSGIALVFVEAERRVRDSWRRVGLSSSAREEKWQAFVTQQLTPFVHRYMVEVEGEEQQLIRSNSKRLLTMLVLYSHLKENSRDASPAVSRVLRQVPHLCGRGLSSSDSARSSVSLVFRRDPSWEDLVRLSRQLAPTLLEVMEVHSQQAAQEELELEVERLSALAQFRVGVMDKLLLQQRMLGQRADGITLEDTTSASGQSGVRGTTTSSTHFASAAFASAKSTVHDMSSTRQSTTKRAMAAGDEEELQMLFSAPAYRATLNPRSTSFLLPPRFTAGGTSELVESSPVRVAPHTSTPAQVVEKAEEATTSASTSCTGTGGRAVNANDEITDDEVDAFQDASRACGGEADLSLARISQEAEEVLRQVEAQRLLLQCDSDAQLQHIRGLFDEIAKEGHQKHTVLSCTDDSPIMADLLAYVSRLRIADEEVEHPSGNFEEVEQKVNDMRQSASTDLDVPSQDAVERSLQSDLPVAARRALRCFSYVEVMRYVYIVRQTLQYALLRRYYTGVDHGSRSIANCAAEYVSITQDNAMSSVVDYAAALRDGTISSNFVPQKNGLAAVEELDRCLACARQTAVEVEEKRVPLLEMLSVVRRAAPLLQRRQAIQDEQRALQEGSRERLLSKKINMAKQLLYEENLRKCVAKELPVLLGELGGLLKQWQQVAPPGAVLRVRGVEVQRLLEEEATGVRSRAQPTRGRTVSRSMTPAPRALSQSSLMLSQSSISRSRVGSRSPPPRMPSNQGPPKPTLASSLRMKATKAASAAHKSSIPPAVLKPRMRSSLPPPLSKRNGTKPLTATSVERVGKGHLSPLSTNSTTPPSPKQLWRRPEDASSSQDRPRFKR